jgi:methylenetetrahydrofolate dehydrogenase (NADP+)/methenyltetrahydrofolate cyclohydrolase
VAALIEGRQLAGESKRKMHRTIEAAMACGGQRPGLAVVKSATNRLPHSTHAASAASARMWAFSPGYDLSAATPEAELLGLVDALNRDARVDGILVQLPLPKRIGRTAVIPLSPGACPGRPRK